MSTEEELKMEKKGEDNETEENNGKRKSDAGEKEGMKGTICPSCQTSKDRKKMKLRIWKGTENGAREDETTTLTLGRSSLRSRATSTLLFSYSIGKEAVQGQDSARKKGPKK